VPDRHHVLVHVVGLLDHVLLARRVALRDLHRLERVRERIGQLAGALDVVLPAEHLVDDVHVAEQVGDDAMIGLALDVVEQGRTAAVEMLLQPGDLEVGIDRLVALDQIALCPEPFQRVAEVVAVALDLRFDFRLADSFLHDVFTPLQSRTEARGSSIVGITPGVGRNCCTDAMVGPHYPTIAGQKRRRYSRNQTVYFSGF
jgi:hypothetical protein